MDLNKGRQAARNAMAKMNGTGSGNSGTPAGSRGGTPQPEGGDGRRENGGGGGEDDDEDEKIKGPGGVRKKVLKKGFNKLKKDNLTKSTNSGSNGKLRHSLSSSAGVEAGKRDFDSIDDSDNANDGDNVHVKKRQKLQRVESATSFGSQSVDGVGMERTESQDAYVNDGSSFVDGEESD